MGTDNNRLEERAQRKRFLIRQERRRRLIGEITSTISALARRDIKEDEVLQIEEVDNYLISLNSSDFDFNYLNLSFPKTEYISLLEMLKELRVELNTTNYFKLSQWSDVAVLKWIFHTIVYHLFQWIVYQRFSAKFTTC
jgi:hypothetical protein